MQVSETKQHTSTIREGTAGRRTFFQPKLTVNQPGDEYEQEANAIADNVMRMPINDNAFFSPKPLSISRLQRKCKECEEEERLQRKETGNETTADAATENYINTLNGKGHSLTEKEKSFFEPGFGYDFSKVQLHTDVEANQSAKNVNAQAYTYGNNIVFGANQYQPNTNDGKKLMAHELTHVAQQNRGFSRKIIQRKCADHSVKSSQWVSVKNEYDFTAVDGYTPLRDGTIVDVLFDGKNYFFCYNEKKIYLKYDDTEAGVIQDFEKMYGIKVENGDDTWKPSELAVVSEALANLSTTEVSGIRGYRFIKEGGVRIDDGDKVTAGLTTQDIIDNDYTIQFWKFCFDGSSDTEVPHTGVSKGVPCVLHEIGHALMFARRRPWMQAMYFKDKYQKLYENASLEKQKMMKPKLNELMNAEDKAEKENSARPTVDEEFLKLTRGKKPLTDYSKKNEDEAFAEAFAIYKINPGLLKKQNPKLYAYFFKAGYQ